MWKQKAVKAVIVGIANSAMTAFFYGFLLRDDSPLDNGMKSYYNSELYLGMKV